MYYQNPMVTQQPQNYFIGIGSEAEARNYHVAYGSSITFKDENAPYLYTKTSLSQMEPPIFKKYRLVDETPQNAPLKVQEVNLSDYVTKTEFEALQKELKALADALGGVGDV